MIVNRRAHAILRTRDGAHAVRNESAAAVRYAMPSSWRPEGFVAVRPDEGTALVVGPDFRRVASLLPEETAWV